SLIEDDHSWVFTEAAADSEAMDPQGSLVGLTYPLILLYHHPDLFQMEVGKRELDSVLDPSHLAIQPGYREGLRAMWEIVGFVMPEATKTLQEYCSTTGHEPSALRSEETTRLLIEMADGLKLVVEQGLGLVVE